MGNSANQSKKSSRNKYKDEYQPTEPSKYQPSKLKLFLINGYVRKHATYFIHEINQICFIYYGAYAEHLVYIEDHDHWFENIKDKIDIFKYANNRRLKITPITQYIDNRYQILFCSINKFSWIDWKGFLAIDMKTNEVHKIVWAQNKYGYANYHDKYPKNIDLTYFHLLMSKALTLRAIETNFINGNKTAVLDYFGSENAWLKLKNQTNIESIEEFDNNDANEVSIEAHDLWHQFEYNLWDLFVLNLLYNPKKKIENQQIWKVIQFLSLLCFESNQCSQTRIHLTIPQLIINKNDYKNVCNEILEMNNIEIRKYLSTYITLDVEKDIHAKTIEYKNGKLLKCKCFMAVNWGGGYATTGGFDKNIYCATFEIEKKDEINVKLYFERIMTNYCEGDELS